MNPNGWSYREMKQIWWNKKQHVKIKHILWLWCHQRLAVGIKHTLSQMCLKHVSDSECFPFPPPIRLFNIFQISPSSRQTKWKNIENLSRNELDCACKHYSAESLLFLHHVCVCVCVCGLQELKLQQNENSLLTDTQPNTLFKHLTKCVCVSASKWQPEKA